jgi:hypothetical protein
LLHCHAGSAYTVGARGTPGGLAIVSRSATELSADLFAGRFGNSEAISVQLQGETSAALAPVIYAIDFDLASKGAGYSSGVLLRKNQLRKHAQHAEVFLGSPDLHLLDISAGHPSACDASALGVRIGGLMFRWTFFAFHYQGVRALPSSTQWLFLCQPAASSTVASRVDHTPTCSSGFVWVTCIRLGSG